MNTSHPVSSSRSSATAVPPPLPVANRLVQWSAISAAVIFSLALFSVAGALMKNGERGKTPTTTAQSETDVRRRVAASRYETAQSEAAALRRELIAVEGEKQRFEASVNDYLLYHKIAV